MENSEMKRQLKMAWERGRSVGRLEAGGIGLIAYLFAVVLFALK